MSLLLYVASPLGFTESGRDFYYQKLLPGIRKQGYGVLDPWANDTSTVQRVAAMPYGARKRRAWARLNSRIGQQNTAAIDRCSGVVAVLDGPDVDSGTAAEIGYAFAKGKRVTGYRSDFRLCSDNEGALVNLQVEFFVRASGGKISLTLSDLFRELRKWRSGTAHA